VGTADLLQPFGGMSGFGGRHPAESRFGERDIVVAKVRTVGDRIPADPVIHAVVARKYIQAVCFRVEAEDFQRCRNSNFTADTFPFYGPNLLMGYLRSRD
jgi:hypothetical protein